jgi:alginate O-acetyltransferase complex protein AlgI
VLFTEPIFLFVFLPLLLVLHAWPRPRVRNAVLLVASVVFYAWGGGAFTWLILASILLNYSAALAVDRHRGTPAGRRWLAAAVAGNLAVLAIFKYTTFAVGNLNQALVTAGLSAVSVPAIVLPIGISFFTFHAISYVVDVHRRDAVAQKGLVEAALYLLLFPQLIAGPIVRYRDIAAQLTRRAVAFDDVAAGVRRFLVGLGKKMLIANLVAGPADRIFAMPSAELTAAHAWLGVACYTLQIYFDFSGYSDMAIGLARVFGFRFPENFRYPYAATSIQDFWRRWHISLSAWFRDYLYVPLGGNRVGPARLYLNLLVVFALCGLWHGANWTFVVWGLFHGFFLVAERLGLAAAVARLPRVLRHVYTVAVVMVGWAFFRADSIGAATGLLAAMAGAGPAQPTVYAASYYLTPELVLAAAAGVLGAGPLMPALARLASSHGPSREPALGSVASALAMLALVGVFAACLMLIAARTYNPFIYFQF